MMGFVIDDTQAPIIKTTNCLLVQTHQVTKTEMPCIRCGECAAVCPAQLLPQQLYWHARKKDYEKTQEYHLFDCIECGCCSYVCPSNIPLVKYYRIAKQEIAEEEITRQKTDSARNRFEARNKRLQEEEKQHTRDKSHEDDTGLDDKKAYIEAAVKRTRAKRDKSGKHDS